VKKKLFLAIAVVVAVVIAYKIYRSLLPEEARIRSMILEIGEAFNDGHTRGICRRLAGDFREEVTGAEKEDVRIYLGSYFFTERKKGMPELLVEVLPEKIQVKIGNEDSPSAEILVEARFYLKSPDGKTTPRSTIRFTGHLIRPEGDWLISRSRHEILEGGWPFR